MDLSYFTPRVLTGIINLRPVKHDLFTHFFRPLDPKPANLAARGVHSALNH